MKTLKTIILIAGILVAALAFNTSVAQEVVEKQEKVKLHKQEAKADRQEPSKLKIKNRTLGAERKQKQRSDVKAEKRLDKREQKVKVKHKVRSAS